MATYNSLGPQEPWNLNYPDYGMLPASPQISQEGMWGDVLSSSGDAAGAGSKFANVAAPYIAGAGAVAKLAGTGMKIYSAFKDADEAKQRYRMLMKEWERKKRIEEEDRAREIKRQKLNDAFYGSAQSSALEDRFASAYPGYRVGGQ